MNHLNRFICLITYFSAIPLTLAVTCPMDLSYVLTIPWDTSSCHATNFSSSPLNNPCCNTLLSLYGIAFAQRLKDTNFFELPDLDTSVSCLQSFQSKLESLDLPTNISSFCFDPHQFVISENNCGSIQNSTDLVSQLEPFATVLAELNSSCSSNLRNPSNCTSCRTASFVVRDKLLELEGTNDNSDLVTKECYFFTIIYAAGIINSLDLSKHDVLSCILSLPMKTRGKSSRLVKIEIVVGAVGGTLFILTMAAFVFLKCKQIVFWNSQSKGHQDMENFIKNYGTSLVPRRFKYSEVKKMTNSFKEKLGQGGFGAVYKGKLRNQTLVAVKLLHELKGNGEDFINEVASISRTSHVNVVTLLGFCLEGKKRALIYEYMCNQSLDKFLCCKNPEKHLGWKRLHQIAVGIARGLEYLHRGCNTRILHFDIKPQNILLDDDFHPKISDFGLSKLCLKKESILSTLTTRGTIGYIAPEVFNRHFGGVSHKSDVYSYGMMLIDMVGGRRKLDEGGDKSSEYFPDQVYRLLEQDNNDLGLHHDPVTSEEKEICRKMIAVGIWCIQTVPSQRPSITRVIELLEGSIEALQMPPKPYLSSPPRSLPLESFSSLQSL